MEKQLTEFLKWDRPLVAVKSGSYLTFRIDLLIDFDWKTEVGHPQKTFTNYMSLGAYVRKNTAEGRMSALVLTNQEGKSEGCNRDHDSHDVFVVNISRFKAAARNDASSAYFAGLQGTPILGRAEPDEGPDLVATVSSGSASDIAGWINEHPREFASVAGEIDSMPLEAVDLASLTSELEQRLKDLTKEEAQHVLTLLTSSEFPANLLDAVSLARRNATVEEFKTQLDENVWDEKNWEKFFKDHQWIFGHGLLYQFVTQVENQVNAGGKDISNTGGQIGDFAVRSMGDRTSFIALVDIKVPGSALVGAKYRNRTYAMSDELSGAVSQVLNLCDRWVHEGSGQTENVEKAFEEGWLTAAPRGILIVGHNSQLDNKEKKRSFELFRRSIHNLEILTFDELLIRASAITDPENS